MKDLSAFSIVLTVIASLLGIIAAILLIFLRKAQIQLKQLEIDATKTRKESIEKVENEFSNVVDKLESKVKESIQEVENKISNLVVRLDTKVSAFTSLLFPRIYGGRTKPLIDDIGYLPGDGFNQIQARKSEATLFKFRATHYSAEKILICKRFLEFIRGNQTISACDRIYLLIDSGSTVFPLFKLLCDYYWDNTTRPFFEKIRIFTNNIPGLTVLTQYGRRGSDVTADTIYKCSVIPGFVEGKYSAILGEEGPTHLNYRIDEIKERRKEEGEKSIILSVLTGNYISLENGVLWRGAFHGQMKNALIYNSDQVFILSPLGKIFDESIGSLNKIISETDYPLAVDKQYKSLKDSEAKLKPLKAGEFTQSESRSLLPSILIDEKPVYLITTERETSEHYPIELLKYFSDIYTKLGAIFHNGDLVSDIFSPQTDSDQVIIELNMYKDEKEPYLNYEFPHPEIRNHMRKELF